MTEARTQRTTVALAGVALLSLALVACGSTVSGGGSGAGDLPVLRIGARLGGAPDAAAAASGATAADDSYPLVGTLPTGPTSAPVHRYGSDPVAASTVTALAAALGLSGSAVRHAHGSVMTGAAGELRVRDGGQWSFARTDDLCPPQRVDVDATDPSSVAVGCAVSSPGAGTIVSSPPKDAAAAAGPVLSALGLAKLPARVDDQGDTSVVTVEPTVGGTVTTGIGTAVTVDARGVRSAYGVAGQPVEGPAYPLVTAAQALEWLRQQPRPEIAIACAIGQTCPGVGPQKVTGASLGLTAAYDGGEQILVPAWMFTIQGQGQPAVVVAVADRYLGDPEPAVGSGGGSAGSEPGSSGSPIPPSDPGMSPEPVPTASDLPLPVQGNAAIESASVSADGRTLTLHGWGGTCASYAGTAREDSRHVYAQITSTFQSPGQACNAMAVQVEVTVALAAPLGSRTVVDETSSTERVVPVS